MTLSAVEAEALRVAHHTPYYAYDVAVLRARARLAREALAGAHLFYAMKANPNPELLRALHGEVAGLDIASVGELQRALEGGWQGTQLSFAGPGKSEAALRLAVSHDVLVSVESLRELDEVARLGAALGKTPRVRLRVNPDTKLQAYRVTMVGGPSPFGIDQAELPQALARVQALGGALRFDGLHLHPGAQCTSVGGVAAALTVGLDLCEGALRLGLPVASLNLGGGFGVVAPGKELDLVAVGQRVRGLLQRFTDVVGQAPRLSFEPGRWLVGPAGLYVASVVSLKVSRGVRFVVLDGGFNHHLTATGHLQPKEAPRLELVNLSAPLRAPVTCSIVGPLCTPLDRLATDLQLPEPHLGDLIGITCSGAYGYTFSPLHFLGHPLPAELVLNART